MPKVLLVDEEPAVRSTLRQILERSGFITRTAASVSEALGEILSTQFDILIADLNIGEPGDGLTIISAMHRVHPNCRKYILTGLPAVESALQAIRGQIDGCILKPANTPALVDILKKGLEEPPRKSLQGKLLSVLVRERMSDLVYKTLALMKKDARLMSLQIDDSERIDHLPAMIEQLAILLESEYPENTPREALEKARMRGRFRGTQGFTSEMLVSEARLFLTAVSNVIEENLLFLDISRVVSDFKWLRDSVLQQLEESLTALNAVDRELAS